MSLCSRNCGISVPEPLSNQCSPEIRGGGISHIIFFSCDVHFNDVYDISEWCQYIREGKIAINLEVLGQKPKASAVKKKMSSCRTEAITGFDYTVTFQDYNADNQEFRDFDFYNTLQTYYQSYQVAYITCEGHIYGFNPDNGGSSGNFINNISLEVSHVIEEDFNGSSYWDGVLTWKGKYEFKPIDIPNLLNYLKDNEACDNIYPPTPLVCPDCTDFGNNLNNIKTILDDMWSTIGNNINNPIYLAPAFLSTDSATDNPAFNIVIPQDGSPHVALLDKEWGCRIIREIINGSIPFVSWDDATQRIIITSGPAQGYSYYILPDNPFTVPLLTESGPPPTGTGGKVLAKSITFALQDCNNNACRGYEQTISWLILDAYSDYSTCINGIEPGYLEYSFTIDPNSASDPAVYVNLFNDSSAGLDYYHNGIFGDMVLQPSFAVNAGTILADTQAWVNIVDPQIKTYFGLAASVNLFGDTVVIKVPLSAQTDKLCGVPFNVSARFATITYPINNEVRCCGVCKANPADPIPAGVINRARWQFRIHSNLMPVPAPTINLDIEFLHAGNCMNWSGAVTALSTATLTSNMNSIVHSDMLAWAQNLQVALLGESQITNPLVTVHYHPTDPNIIVVSIEFDYPTLLENCCGTTSYDVTPSVIEDFADPYPVATLTCCHPETFTSWDTLFYYMPVPQRHMPGGARIIWCPGPNNAIVTYTGDPAPWDNISEHIYLVCP